MPDAALVGSLRLGVRSGCAAGRGVEVAAEVGLVGVAKVSRDLGPGHPLAVADRLGYVKQPVAAQYPGGGDTGMLHK